MPGPPAEPAAEPIGRAGRSAHILVVDDEAMIRKVLRRILTSRGHQVTVAENGAHAREALQAGACDLILSDINMPRMDGLGLLRLVRERDPDLPVILITADPSADSAIGALELRATGYLRKPVDPQTVAREVDKALTLRELARARQQAHELVSSERHDREEAEQLAAAFGRALESLYMVYQPIVRWPAREVFGYEALVRTAEPTIPHPGALFDAAERLSKLRDLGRAIRAQCTVPVSQLPPRASVFVNLDSADLLDDELFDTNAPLSSVAERVVLEITERAHLAGVRDVVERIARLRGHGFRVAIDDIGGGYSGLNSFAMLKPDLVTLDMALVRDVDRDPVRQRVTRMLIHLCLDLGISVVGEGVETAAERDTLAAFGCPLFQGYLFARPNAPFGEPIYG